MFKSGCNRMRVNSAHRTINALFTFISYLCKKIFNIFQFLTLINSRLTFSFEASVYFTHMLQEKKESMHAQFLLLFLTPTFLFTSTDYTLRNDLVTHSSRYSHVKKFYSNTQSRNSNSIFGVVNQKSLLNSYLLKSSLIHSSSVISFSISYTCSIQHSIIFFIKMKLDF